MTKKFSILSLLIIAALVLSSCATPQAPAVQTVEVVKEVVKTQVVEVPVESTRVVEVQVTSMPQEKGLVEFAGFYPADSAWGRDFRLIGYRLEAENPECKFVYTEYPGAEAYKAVSLRAQEGDPPSIDAAGGSSLAPGGGDAWKAGYYYDLAKEMQEPAYGETSGTWFDTFNEAAQKYMQIDNAVASIPYQQTQIIMWYNADHYTQFNLQPPKTWEDLMANCEVLKSNGVACIGGGGFSGYIGYWYDMILFRLMGNDVQSALYNRTDPNLKWTDPEPIKAAEMIVEMIDKGYTVDGFVGGDFTANQVAYFTGKATHIFVGTWLMGEMKDSIPEGFNQAVMYFPTVTGYESKSPYEAAFGFINSLGLYKPTDKQKEPHDLPCTVKYLKLLSSKEVQSESVKSLDYVSVVKDVPGPANIPGIGELLSDMQLWFPAFQNLSYTAPELRSKMWDNVAALGNGTLTPQEFGEQMQKDWDEFFNRQ